MTSAPERMFAFLFEKTQESIVVFDGRQRILFQNERARRFLERHRMPEEITTRLPEFARTAAAGTVAQVYPGQFCLAREIGGRRWIFRVALREGADPLVCVYFVDETVSGRFDLNAARQQYRLTRRETDALRHLLDGLSNIEIAEELGVIEQTVKDYLGSVYAKVGVQDRFSLLRHLVGSFRG